MRGVFRLSAVVVALMLVVLVATPAFAHENRDVGAYRLTVGFNVEPAFEGEMNGAQFRVRRLPAATEGVAGLQDTLKVDVTYGATTKTMALRSVFGTPGLYVADFVPTASGRYKFRFYGMIETTQVDELFESGPGRFSDIQPVGDVQFPVQVAAATEIKTAADRAVVDAATATASANDASDAASQARMLGIVGILTGVLGVAVGGVALMGRKRS